MSLDSMLNQTKNGVNTAAESNRNTASDQPPESPPHLTTDANFSASNSPLEPPITDSIQHFEPPPSKKEGTHSLTADPSTITQGGAVESKQCFPPNQACESSKTLETDMKEESSPKKEENVISAEPGINHDQSAQNPRGNETRNVTACEYTLTHSDNVHEDNDRLIIVHQKDEKTSPSEGGHACDAPLMQEIDNTPHTIETLSARDSSPPAVDSEDAVNALKAEENEVKPHQFFKDEKEATEKIIKYDPENLIANDEDMEHSNSNKKAKGTKRLGTESARQPSGRFSGSNEKATMTALRETKKRTREQNSSSPKSTPEKNALSSSSTAAPNDDTDLSDDELNENSSHKSPSRKLKKRRTSPGRGSTSGSRGSESRSVSSRHSSGTISDNLHLTLNSLPRGWRDPLCYFAMLKAYVDEKGLTKKAWMRLPLRRVSNGAAWLTESCSGTPGVSDHVDGPTEIVRDLCSCMQGSEDEFKLHPRSHVSITQGTIRKDFDNSKLDVQHPFTIPRLIRIQTEKEYIHFLPLDLVASQVCQQIRSIVTTSGLFPSHIFAPDIHVCQHAPTIALHLALYQKSKTLDSLLSTFLNTENHKQFDAFRNFYNKHLASKATSNRRRRGAELGDVFTGTVELSQSDIQDFSNLCDLIDKQLDALRTNVFQNPRSTSNGLSQKSYAPDDVIIKDLPATILTRYSAALRDHVYQYYDIPPHILAYDLDEDHPIYDGLIKESGIWLDSPLGVYIDITLSPSEEDHLISSTRWSPSATNSSKPSGKNSRNSTKTSAQSPSKSTSVENIENRALLHHIVSHTGTNSNTKLAVTLPSAEMRNDVLLNHQCYLSLIATKEIPSNSSIVLDNAWKKVTWAEIAADNETK